MPNDDSYRNPAGRTSAGMTAIIATLAATLAALVRKAAR